MKISLKKWLSARGFQNLDVLQWFIPIFLSITGIGFEIIEHRTEGDSTLDLAFTSEIIIFGLMGPIIVAFIIAWMRQLVNAEKKAIDEIHILNRELEAKVIERTSELEQRNLELAHANKELKHLDEMKSEFVSLVSHELRAPLTALNGGLELALQAEDALPPASKRILETMVSESARLTDFVQTILDVSRLEAGRFTLNLGAVAVTPILRRAVEVVMGERRVIEWTLPANIPPIWADEIYYEQTIRNLLRNADKFSPPQQPIYIAVQIYEDNVSVQITDHGAGIALSIQAAIFERFQRGQHGESAPPGWGLGLYFAKKLTEMQCGALALTSPVWQDEQFPGATFSISMPIAANEPEDSNDA